MVPHYHGSPGVTSARTYRYQGLAAFLAFSSRFGSVLGLLLTGFVAISVAAQESEGFANGKGLTGLSALIAVIGVTACAPMMNDYPTIRVAPEALEVTVFIFHWVRISWSDIRDISELRLPGPSCGIGKIAFLTVRRLTPVHRLMGLLSFQGPFPVIPIHEGLEEHDRLLNEIVANVRASVKEK